jgi:uncharacterized protein (TIGR03083 family)
MRYDPVPTIRREADAFLVAARRGLEPMVPGCPEWTVGDLTFHLGSVYRFHTAHVTRGVTTQPAKLDIPDVSDDVLLEWFDEGVDELLIALRSTDPDLPAWNWAAHTPQVASFWGRRMALETAVHRWDAESAHNEAGGFDVDIAVDGIDEMVTVMGPSGPEPDSPTGTAVLRTTDSGDAWAVQIGPGRFDVLPEIPAQPDAVLEGTSTALLLALWGRGADVTETGDAALLEYLQS